MILGSKPLGWYLPQLRIHTDEKTCSYLPMGRRGQIRVERLSTDESKPKAKIAVASGHRWEVVPDCECARKWQKMDFQSILRS